MLPSCIACNIVLQMLSNFSCERSLIALCFSYFTVNILTNFFVSLLISTNKQVTPLANIAVETSPVITVDVIRPVSVMFVILMIRLIFSVSGSRTTISSGKYASTLLILDLPFVMLVLQCSDLESLYLCSYPIQSFYYLIAEDRMSLV